MCVRREVWRDTPDVSPPHIILAYIFLLTFLYHQRPLTFRQIHANLPADTTEDFESVKSGLLSLASLQVATDNFHKSKKIGEGGFGEVYQVVGP